MDRLVGHGRYVLGAELGIGGMGVVYAAEDLARLERVAVKIAHRESAQPELVAQHMARELAVGRATRHPNVVGVLDGGSEAGRPFLVMELATGRSLGALAGRRVSLGRIVGIVDQILAGLGAIHRTGYVHGDLKPDNILVDERGDRVTIIDLGLACEQTATTKPLISGTPLYMAPELALGRPKSIASDLYAVGAMIYELLTGTSAVPEGPVVEVLRHQVEDEVLPPSQRLPGIPLALDRVILRALAKQPHARHASAEELRGALHGAVAGCPAIAIPRHACPSIPTVPWIGVPPPRRAAGSTAPPSLPQRTVEAALEAAGRSLSGHRWAAARDQLEAGVRALDLLPAAEPLEWRLLLPLAAVYEGLHDPQRARRIARLALDSAGRAGSAIGRERAKQLIVRLTGRRY